jgi:hypothetical protein
MAFGGELYLSITFVMTGSGGERPVELKNVKINF